MEDVQKLKRATYHLWTFTISKLLSTFGASIFAFGAGLFILDMTGSATNFAITMICSVVPRILLAPIVGYLADNFPKKPIIIIAQIGSVIAVSSLLTYSLMHGGVSVLSIYITTAALSVTSSFSGITFSSAIANLIDPERIQKAMSFNQASLSIATIGGPVIGGMLYSWTTINVFIIIQIIGYSIAVILESTMNFRLFTKRTDEELSEKKESIFEGIKGGIIYLKTQKVISVIVWVSLWINFFFAALLVGLPFILREKLLMEATHFGYVEGIMSIGMLVGAIYFSTRKEAKYPLQFSKRGVLILGLLMALFPIPTLFNFSYYTNFVYYLVLMFTFGGTLIFINTPIGVVLQKEIAEEFKGRVFGILETMATAMMPIGAIIFGLMYDAVAPVLVIWISCALLFAVVLYMMRRSVIALAYPELAKNKSMQTNIEKSA